MLSDTEFKGEGPVPSGSGPPLVIVPYGELTLIYFLMKLVRQREPLTI